MGNTFITSFGNLEKCFLNSKKIESIQCLILDLQESEDPNFFLFKVFLNDEINEEFLISKLLLINTIKMKEKDDEKHLLNSKEIESKNNKIEKYDLYEIKNLIINYYIIIDKIQGLIKNINKKNILCFQILNFKIKGKNTSININNINSIIKKKFYFIESIYTESFKFNMNTRVLISTYLKCLGKDKNKNKCQYKDSKDNIIELDKILEKNKTYFFGYLFYDPINKSVSFIKTLSFYEEINASLNKNSKTFQITNQNNLIIEGKVINALFHENKIQVRVSNSERKDKIINIQLDNNLMKNITFNGITYFINFIFEKENKFSFGKFSHIIIDTETIIEINFVDYKETNKYDMVKIDSQIFKINNKKLRIVLNKYQEKNYFREKLMYLNNNKIIHSFIIEIYRNRTNKYESFLNLENDGFCYEFLYISKNEKNLLVNQKIILDEKKNKSIIFSNLEKFENKLKGRICIINIPEQILDEKVEANINKNNCKSFKYLILMQGNQVNSINKFQLNLDEEKKYPFYMDENYKKQLYSFYNIYKKDFKKFENDFETVNKEYPLLFGKEENSFEDEIDYPNNKINNINNEDDSDDEKLINENEMIDKRRLKSINEKVIKDSNNYRKYIELSFLKFNFENSQIQFKQIKMLCFLYILKYMPKANIALKLKEEIIIKNYKYIVKKSKGLPYIDRIRILISFINNKIFDNDLALKNCYTFLIKIDDTLNECDYIRKAYKILYKILDNLNENSSLFIALHQLNSYIEYDYYTDCKMFSSSILTVNDVKLDFFKNNQGYFFVNDIIETRTYAFYCPYTKIIYYNPYSFLKARKNIDILKLKKNNINIKATCVSLFLTFHEDCGHLKNGINNIEDTPRQFYNNDLVVQKGGVLGINDSGYIIEFFLNEGVIRAKSMMLYKNISDIESLLDFNQYITSDLNGVKTLLNKILFKKNKKSNLKGKKQKELLEDDDIDYEKMNVDELFNLLSKKPENMSDEEYNKYLKNHRGYKALLKLYSGRKKP